MFCDIWVRIDKHCRDRGSTGGILAAKLICGLSPRGSADTVAGRLRRVCRKLHGRMAGLLNLIWLSGTSMKDDSRGRAVSRRRGR